MSLRKWTGLAAASFLIGYLASGFRGGNALGDQPRQRGRMADEPGQMTWLGWKDILLRTFNEMGDDRLLSVAAAVAFYALLALVPMLSVLVSLYGLVADPNAIAGQLAPFLNLMPPVAQELIIEQSVRLASKSNSSLSMALFASLLLAGWSANAAVKAMFEALNIIYDETEKRSFIWYNMVTLFTTLSAAAVGVLALTVIAVIPAILAFFPFQETAELLVRILRWPALFAVAVLAIATLYRIGPSRRPPKWRWVMPGAVLSAALWALASFGFSYYVTRLGDYSATYGSLATVVIFMTWLWLSATIVLLGGELNSELEHQTAQDTTRGLPKPIGMRGARMADNIGPAVAKD